MPMIPLGKWAPDLIDIGSGVLILAQNVIPRHSKYDSIPTLVSAELGALNGLCRGAFSGRTSSGQNFTVAGTSNRLYLGTTGDLANVSLGGAAASPYTVGTNQWWDFALYGNRIIATNHTDEIQSYVIGTSTEFAALSADSPAAKHIAVVRGFLVGGNIVGRGVNAAAIGTDESAIQWSALDNPTSWPQVGTAAAHAVQSDWQPLTGPGGAVTDIVGGSDFGIICRDRSLWRMDYEGGDTFFRLTPISENVGCVIPKAAIRHGGLIYFPSEDGFYVTNGVDVVPIGHDINRFFFGDIQPNTEYRVSRMDIPEWDCLGWLYMAQNASAEICNRIVIYNPKDAMWAVVNVSCEWLVDVLPFTDSLDSYSDSMDTGVLSAVNLDTLLAASSRSAGGFISGSHALGIFNGEPGTALLETGDYEPSPGRVAVVRSVRLVFDSVDGDVSVSVGHRMRPADPVVYTPSRTPDITGKSNMKATGRYLRTKALLTGEFVGVHGFDVDLRVGGSR